MSSEFRQLSSGLMHSNDLNCIVCGPIKIMCFYGRGGVITSTSYAKCDNI